MSLGCEIAGDGFCDDSTNDGRCDFDGGDCCLPNKNTTFCSYCFCYAEGEQGPYVRQDKKNQFFGLNEPFLISIVY